MCRRRGWSSRQAERSGRDHHGALHAPRRLHLHRELHSPQGSSPHDLGQSRGRRRHGRRGAASAGDFRRRGDVLPRAPGVHAPGDRQRRRAVWRVERKLRVPGGEHDRLSHALSRPGDFLGHATGALRVPRVLRGFSTAHDPGSLAGRRGAGRARDGHASGRNFHRRGSLIPPSRGRAARRER